jgi:hypothetical protein
MSRSHQSPTFTQFHWLCFLMSIVYVYAMQFAPSLAHKKNVPFYNFLNTLHEGCIIDLPSANLNSMRGTNYFIGAMNGDKSKKLKGCLLTFWGLTHFLFYFLVGYMCPDYIDLAFIISFVFEYYEYRVYKCHDVLDIFLNVLGLYASRLVL